MSEKFFENPLNDAELEKAIDNQLDNFEAKATAKEEEKWRTEARNLAALQRFSTETVDKLSALENRQKFAMEHGEETEGEIDKIASEMRELQYKLDTAHVIEQNINERIKSLGKTLEDASYEEANIDEKAIDAAQADIAKMIDSIAEEHNAQEAARKKIAELDEPFHDMQEAA